MAHVWEQLVLGGVDAPRILILENNLCTNQFFTKGITGWTLVTDSNNDELFERVLNDNASGQYMGHITYTNNKGYVECTYDFGESIEDKIFFFCVDIISENEDFTLALFGDTEFGITHFDSSLEKKRCFVIATATAQTSETLSIRIYGTRSEPGDPLNADLYFDNIYFSEVIQDITMPQPNDAGKMVFEKEMIGDNILTSHKHSEFRVRWVPNYLCEYFYLTKEYEEYREQIAKSEILFIIPHLDLHWGFLGRWMPLQFIRSYLFNEYDGHSGTMAFAGNENFIKKPQMKVGD